MIGCVVGLLAYIILFFVACLMARVAYNKNSIDDFIFPVVIGIFVPFGIIAWIGAIWLGDVISDNL